MQKQTQNEISARFFMIIFFWDIKIDKLCEDLV